VAADAEFRWDPIEPGQVAQWASLRAAIAVAAGRAVEPDDDLLREFDNPYCDFQPWLDGCLRRRDDGRVQPAVRAGHG
jgi:hypothetical protein